MSARGESAGAITTGRTVRCRQPTPSDGRALWALARDVGLDLNSPYAYVLWGDHFADTSVVAQAPDGTVVGFITGFRPPRDAAAVFVWQVGVAEAVRGQGVGGRMLDELLARTGARWLEATVTPSNAASAALFRGIAARHGTALDEALVYPGGLFPDGHEPEVRFRIGPLDGSLGATADTTDHARNPRM